MPDIRIHIIIPTALTLILYIFFFPGQSILFLLACLVLPSIGIEVDHLLTILCFPQNEVEKTAGQLLQERRIKELSRHIKIKHKAINHLIFHNVFAFIISVGLFFLTIDKSLSLSLVFFSVLLHQSMDQLEDIAKIHHYHNWLWVAPPLRNLSGSIVNVIVVLVNVTVVIISSYSLMSVLHNI